MIDSAKIQINQAQNRGNVSEIKKPLWTSGFVALLITQFLVALNDNLFRWLIIPIGKYAVGWSENPDQVRMIGALAFLVPFLIFTSYAGYFCDRFNRRSVIIGCKVAEVIIILFGIWGILTQSVPFMLVVLFCLGAQSAFFSPAKYSALPTVVPVERISEANGYYTLTTMVACIGGQLLGGALFVMTTIMPEGGKPAVGTGGMDQWWIWACALLAVAVFGLLSSFFIPSMKAVDLKAKFPLNPFYQTFADLRFLFRHRFVFWAAMGSSFFWGFSALAQSNIDKFGDEILQIRQDSIMLLLVLISFGLAAGAMIAGKTSRGRIEFGLVPIGALLIIVFALFLAFTPQAVVADAGYASIWTGSFLFGAVGLLLLGTAAGMFDIPLLASIQTKSPVEHRGRILAAYNFYSFASMALFSVFQGILSDKNVCGLSANAIWGGCALLTIPVLYFSFKAFFVPFLDFVIYYALWLIYRPRIIDAENVPETGGVLLVSNHVSYLDSLLIHTSQKRPVRFIAHKDFIPKGFPTLMAKATGVIAIDPGNTRNIVEMIRTVRRALADGEVVCIFAEGGITRTGQMRGFEPGFLSMLKGNPDVPVVPVWLGGLWGSLFAYTKPIDSRKRVRRLLQRVTVAFGKPIFSVKNKYQVERAVEELGVDAMDPNRFPNDRHYRLPLEAMFYGCRKFGRRVRFVDSTGVRLSGRGVILRSLVARRVFRRILTPGENTVGLLLPTSVGGALANVAVSLNGKVPANLNFTFGNETLDYCCDLAGIEHVITSRRFLQKMPNLKLRAKLILIEDALQKVPLSDKLLALLESMLPTALLVRLLGVKKIRPNDLMTIVFTSGSTGRPKGAMLSYMNVAANVTQFYQLFRPHETDSIMGALPLFHSFGYATTLWCPLMTELGVVYHYSPLDAKTIGELCRTEPINYFVGTATFFRQYLRRCPKEDFAKIESVVAGAEKLPTELALAWKEKYGQELIEGFGTTELSPVLSANLPTVKQPDTYHPYQKSGSIGIPLGGLAVRITDPETGAELGPNEPGMLEVKGPNVMLGYYKDPEKTAQVLRDGWYKTGDIAKIDDERFIFITGRQSRISKIGGEMVPHVFLEEALLKILDRHQPAADSDDAVRLAVTAVPDEKKGERIIVLYTDPAVDPETYRRELQSAEIPPLWIPDAANFHPIDAIPLLGTGKLDLVEIKKIAMEQNR